MAEFGADTIPIGGESSGAHLAVVTLLRLRDRHGVALSGANLIFGFYDLTLTPSARLFGGDRVAPRTTDLRSYVKAFVPDGDLAAPELSPLYAHLNNLCPALFTVGSQDPPLADSLFMYMHWLSAGNDSALETSTGA